MKIQIYRCVNPRCGHGCASIETDNPANELMLGGVTCLRCGCRIGRADRWFDLPRNLLVWLWFGKAKDFDPQQYELVHQIGNETSRRK